MEGQPDVESVDVSKRFKTLPLDKLDPIIGQNVASDWRKFDDQRGDFLQRREEWTQNWRNLQAEEIQGPWDNSSNFHIPITLFYGKAIHARLWQLFSDPSFFGVKARKEVFEDREQSIREFMQFVIDSYANGKTGTRDVFDEWLWECVFEGSGFLKLYWQRDVHSYLEVEPVLTVKEQTVFSPDDLTGRKDYSSNLSEQDVEKKEIIETPHIKRILLEDFLMPPGQGDPQTSDWCTHRVFMTEDDLKARARDEKFDKDAVEEALHHKSSFFNDQSTSIKIQRMETDGYFDTQGYYDGKHAVLERYGKAYIKKKIDGKEEFEMSQMPEEVVLWVHQASGLLLGWTYLYRISPSGIRPVFKGDFIKFPDRSHGVGVGEVLDPIQGGINSVYNLRMDNGVLASTPMGFYRASAGLKPDKIQMSPGLFNPTDDPQGDVRVLQMPYLANFGNNEEDRLIGYAERILTISDLQLGRSPQKVGLFRTASGAEGIQNESGIQLEIHFDRIARTLSKLLQALFTLARERMPEELYYRITGENGEPIFGKVSRESLKGQYDFEINIDVLSEGRNEGQQKATMLMQMLINPAFTQTGVVTPDNLYHLARNYLVKNRVRRIDNFVSPPPQYQGEVITPNERVFRIVLNNFMQPPIESTVRMNEDHAKALAIYEGFKQSDHYGMLTSPEQVQALERLIQTHMRFMQAVQAGGNPNASGMQLPREGLAPMQAGTPNQGTLGAPLGEANGPVV